MFDFLKKIKKGKSVHPFKKKSIEFVIEKFAPLQLLYEPPCL